MAYPQRVTAQRPRILGGVPGATLQSNTWAVSNATSMGMTKMDLNTNRRRRILRRGRIYGIKAVDTMAIIGETYRGIQISYTGSFDDEKKNGLEQNKVKSE